MVKLLNGSQLLSRRIHYCRIRKKEAMSTTDKPLVNRIAASGLITLKLEEFFPKAEIAKLDLKDYLFRELLLKEKDFREAMAVHDWEQYQGKILLVYCSTDAILPMWAFMLVAAYAAPFAADVFQGEEKDYYLAYYTKTLAAMDIEKYRDERIIIKGCTDNKPIPANAYVELAKRLQPLAKSIMYGEPCSTVPIYKKPR